MHAPQLPIILSMNPRTEAKNVHVKLKCKHNLLNVYIYINTYIHATRLPIDLSINPHTEEKTYT